MLSSSNPPQKKKGGDACDMQTWPCRALLFASPWVSLSVCCPCCCPHPPEQEAHRLGLFQIHFCLGVNLSRQGLWYLLDPQPVERQKSTTPSLSLKFSPDPKPCQQLGKLLPSSLLQNGAPPRSAQLPSQDPGTHTAVCIGPCKQPVRTHPDHKNKRVQKGPPISEGPGRKGTGRISYPTVAGFHCLFGFASPPTRSYSNALSGSGSQKAKSKYQFLPPGSLFRFKSSFHTHPPDGPMIPPIRSSARAPCCFGSRGSLYPNELLSSI